MEGKTEDCEVKGLIAGGRTGKDRILGEMVVKEGWWDVQSRG